MPLQVEEQFGTALDGTDLFWGGWIPDGPGPFPFIVVLHGGGLYAGTRQECYNRCRDLADAGFFAMSADYRFTGREGRPLLAGQTAPAYYDAIQDDVRMAILAGRNGTTPSTLGKVNNQVGGVGGSSGATLVMEGCCTGTIGVDRFDVGVCLSGAYEFDDAVSLLKLGPPFDFADLGCGYANCLPTDTAILRAASPISKFNAAGITPMFIVASENDPVTPSQYIDVTTGPDGLDANGVTNYQKFLVTGTNGSEHSFHYWVLDGGDGVQIRTKVIAFLESVLTGNAPPPSGIPKGVIAPVSGRGLPTPSALLNNPDIVGIDLGMWWKDFEVTEGTYDFTYFDTEIPKIANKGKVSLIRIATMDGTDFFGGKTPNWVFTEMGKASGARGARYSDAGTTNADPTVTSVTAQFTSLDLHGRISGTGIPVPAYIGLINSPTSIELSSSPTANTPLNATATATNVSITLLDRGRGGPSQLSDAIVTATSPTVTSDLALFGDYDAGKPIQGVGIPPGTTILTVNSAISVTMSANATGNTTRIFLPHRAGLAYDSHEVVAGHNYTYVDSGIGGLGTTTIPVFWNRVFLAKKTSMQNAFGDYLQNTNTLTPTEKQSVAIIAGAWFNAQSDDIAVPQSQGTPADGYCLNEYDAWANLPTALPFPGAGYTTDLMISSAINRGNSQLTCSLTSGSDVLTLLSINNTRPFTYADEDKQVINLSGLPTGTRILRWLTKTTVQLSNPAIATLSVTTVQIQGRDGGICDILMAACPNQFVTTAVARFPGFLDAAGAALAGDGDPSNYICRTVCFQANSKYPGRFITQVNSAKAIPAKVYPDPGGFWQLLGEIKDAGFPTAAQMLWFTYGDTTYRNNGGIPGDAAEILTLSATNAFTFDINYLEIYQADAIGLPEVVTFISELLTGDGGGGGGGGEDDTTVGPYRLPIRSVNLRDDVLFGMASMLNFDIDADLSPERIRRWIASINRHTRYAWEYYDWPELKVMEERAFRSIWNSTKQFHLVGENGLPDELFYIPTFSYYTVVTEDKIVNPPVGTLPTDEELFAPIVLTDRYISLDQDCKMAIGQIYGLYSANPRDIYGTACNMPYRKSHRGIDVWGGNGMTAFIYYKPLPSKFTHVLWSQTVLYHAGDVVLFTDGNCYLMIEDNITGIPPTDSNCWMLVPMPYTISEYVTARAASDMEEDQITSGLFRADAQRLLEREVDKLFEQGNIEQYDPFYSSLNRRPNAINQWLLV